MTTSIFEDIDRGWDEKRKVIRHEAKADFKKQIEEKKPEPKKIPKIIRKASGNVWSFLSATPGKKKVKFKPRGPAAVRPGNILVDKGIGNPFVKKVRNPFVR